MSRSRSTKQSREATIRANESRAKPTQREARTIAVAADTAVLCDPDLKWDFDFKYIIGAIEYHIAPTVCGFEADELNGATVE